MICNNIKCNMILALILNAPNIVDRANSGFHGFPALHVRLLPGSGADGFVLSHLSTSWSCKHWSLQDAEHRLCLDGCPSHEKTKFQTIQTCWWFRGKQPVVNGVKELTQNIGYKLRYRFVFATPRCLASHEMRGWNRKPFGGSKPGALFCSFGIILHTQMILGDKSNKYRHLNLLIFFCDFLRGKSETHKWGIYGADVSIVTFQDGPFNFSKSRRNLVDVDLSKWQF